jgi:hypothetical protein
MGSSQTVQQNEYGSFNIGLDKNAYHPSEQIKGKVKLEISKEYDANGLNVELLGNELIERENLQTITNTVEGRTVTKEEWLKKQFTNPIAQIQKTLWNYLSSDNNKVIEPGFYEAPFELPIPCNAPSTCKLSEGSKNDRIYASVSYQVRGRLSSVNPSKVKNLGCSVPIEIYENSRQECIGEALRRCNINKYYLFGRGYTIASAKLDNANILNNEILKGALKIDNLNCHRDITKILYKVVEEVKLSNVPGINSFQRNSIIREWVNEIRIAPRVTHQTTFNVSVPANTLISVNGNNIKKTYYLEIEPFFPWCNDPLLRIPIHISKST